MIRDTEYCKYMLEKDKIRRDKKWKALDPFHVDARNSEEIEYNGSDDGVIRDDVIDVDDT